MIDGLKILVLAGLFMMSCQFRVEPANQSGDFNLTDYLNVQLESLVASSAGIQKTIRVDGKSEFVELVPDSTGWKKELNLFYGLDIFKPGTLPMYMLSETDSANLHWRNYVLDETAELETRCLSIGYDQAEEIRWIYAEQAIKNPIYSSVRVLNIWIGSNINEVAMIDSFDISGFQQIRSLDSTIYENKSKINRQKVIHPHQ